MTAKTPPTRPADAWRNRIVGSGEEAPDQLLANPANWRVHPKAQQEALAGVLDQVGWVQQVLVNRRTGHVVDGHLRVALALSSGAPTVPVLYVDLEPEEEALVLATLDPLGGDGRHRRREAAGAAGGRHASTPRRWPRCSPSSRRSEPKAGLTDPDDIPEPPDEPTSSRATCGCLGDHRLLCGDADSAADVARLLDGAAPTLLATDPPYSVKLDHAPGATASFNGPRKRVSGWGVVAGAAKPYMMREVPDGQTGVDAPPAKRGHHSRPGPPQHLDRAGHPGRLVRGLRPRAVRSRSATSGTRASTRSRCSRACARSASSSRARSSGTRASPVSRSWYHWAHEPCSFSAGRRAHRFLGERDQATIWRAPVPKKIRAAAGAKRTTPPRSRSSSPDRRSVTTRCRARRCTTCSAGSGTTLIAAERLGRRCYGMEIDPRYAQVVDRALASASPGGRRRRA